MHHRVADHGDQRRGAARRRFGQHSGDHPADLGANEAAKFGAAPGEPSADFVLDHDSEWRLLTKLTEFPDVVASAVITRSVAPIGQFALEAARNFTTFYHDCPVLTAETEARKRSRIQLCAATLQTITNALGILGIEALERM